MTALNWLGVAPVVVALLGSSANAQTTTADKSLLRAAALGWADYETAARARTVRVRAVTRLERLGAEPKEATNAAVVRGNGRCVSLERSAGDDWGGDPDAKSWEGKIVGPEYEFVVQRPPGGSGWALTGVTSLKPEATKRETLPSGQLHLQDRIEGEYLLQAVSVDDVLVSRLINRPCCRTDRFTALPDGSVEWQFTCDVSKRPHGMRLVQSGRAVFDPGRNWVIREYALSNGDGAGGVATVRRTLSYKPAPDGRPIPDEVRTVVTDRNPGAILSFTQRHDVVPQMKPLSDDVFTLIAYGLPESARNQGNLQLLIANNLGTPLPAPTHWYWWLLTAGIGLTTLGAVLLAMRRRVNAPH